VTQTDCALDIFLLRDMVRFSVAVLSDQVGTQFLCSAAENVRWQWPLARILILGRIPAVMNDQLYDDHAGHSMDETALLSKLDKLAGGPSIESMDQVRMDLQGASTHPPATRAKGLRESDPTKLTEASPRGVYERDLPADQYRSNRRGYYAFPPSS